MRLLSVLLLAATALAAPNARNDASFVQLPNYYEPLTTSEPFHVRAKRSIFAAIGISNSCEPGWTGKFCENPMCSDRKEPAAASTTSLVELLFLKGSCGGQYYIPVDTEGGNNLQIHVSASGIPYINLTDANGLVTTPDSVYLGEGYSLTSYLNIKPGGYSLTVDNQNIPTTECIIEVNSKTAMRISQGFVMTPQSDDTPFGESAIDQTPMYFVAHAFDARQPAEVQSVTIRQGSSLTPIYRSLLTRRYGCGYEFYAGQWQCSVGSSYFYHVDGTDANGYAFRRTGRISCMEQITTTVATTTTQAPLSFCYNNGTLLNPAGGSGPTCFCPELYSGKQCDKVQCMNGGFPDPDEGLVCACAEGYHGINCQDVTCPLNWEPALVDYKTLIVVIRDTSSMAQYLPSIYEAISKEINVNEMSDYDVYKGYILVKFAAGKFTPLYYAPHNVDKFLDNLKTPSTTVGLCNDTTFDPITSIYSLAVYQKSPIYLFTDAVAKDYDKWQSVTEANTREKFPIYSFFFPQSACNVDEMDQGFAAIQEVSFFSGGLLLQPDTGAGLSFAIQTVIKATAYKMNSVLIDDLQECSSPTRVFFVDSSTSELIILATGAKISIDVTDPNGATDTLLPIVASGSTFFYEIVNPVIGEHYMTISSKNSKIPCSVRVQARSEYDLFLGTSLLVSEDAGDSEPVLGEFHHFVAQLTGLKNNVNDQFRLFAELTITTNINYDQKYQKPMYYSSGSYRSGCGYHLYFGVANFCEFIDQPFYATVYADDGNGFTIQRTTVGYCSGNPTTPYPPNTCQNGGVFDPQNNASCICPPNFEGQYCQNILCDNGGTPRGGRCECPAGTGGTFCEMYQCSSFNLQPDVSFEGQSLAFVISARASMAGAIRKIADTAQTLTRDIQQASGTWINKWILVVANSETSLLLVNSDKAQDFVAGIQDLLTNLTSYTVPSNDCKVQIEQAILGAVMLSSRRSSVWVFADSDGPNDASYIQIYDVAQEYQLTLNLVGVGNTICTTPENNGQFPYYLRSLATTTLGDVYMTTQLDQILYFIVSLYKSAVSHRFYSADCTQPTSYYMPVDGWTQSLTLAVTGDDVKSVSVTFPDGTQGQNTDYEIVSINDPELKLNQYVAACDGRFWNHRQQNCYEFQSKTFGWLDAWGYCHEEKAFIIHIENQDTNDYVHGQINGYRIWIGLVFNNNQWYWDVPDGNQAQPLTGYTNWADGVDPANPKFNHAVMNVDGKWEPADNSELVFVGCQKHRYGQGFNPGDMNNVVPGGMWKVTVQSNSGGCAVQARSQSEIQVFYGFVQDPRDDSPKTYANIQSNSNYLTAIPTYISPFNPDTRPSLEGRLNYAVLSNEGKIVKALPFTNRICAYSFISSPFSCPQDEGTVSDFSVKFTGLDQYGFAFERYSEALCTKYVQQCFNGGFLSNGQCVCRPGWAGPSCSTPICVNGGIEKNGKCTCEPGFTGLFCEEPICEPPYPTSFKDSGRTLAIVLETSYNMGATIFQMRRNLKAALDSYNNDPTIQGWFTNYVLYPFDSTSNKANWYPVLETSDQAQLLAAVNNISFLSCPGPNPCSSQCPRPIVSVLESVLELDSFTSPNSVILVVTRSSPEDYTQVGRIARKLQELKPYINFVYTSIDSPCGNGWNTPEADALYQITAYSQGNTFTMTAVDFSTSFLTQYVPTLYSSGGLATTSGSCVYQEIIFQVEYEMYEFSIDFYHPMLNQLLLFDPDGELIPLPDNIINSDTNYIGIVPVNETGATRSGSYRLVLEGNGGNACFASVRGRSKLEVFLGFVNADGDQFKGYTLDNAYHAPVNLERDTIVVHVNNLGMGTVMYAQIILPGFGLMHTSEMRKRDSRCSYDWYSVVPYSYDLDHYFIIIHGRSEFGTNWRRTYYVSTVGNRPPLPPPPAYCDLTQKKQDTLFIIDSSLKNSDSTFSTLKHFAAQSMQPYSYSDSKAQVAALSVADKAYGGFSFNAGENSYERVSELITNMQYIGTAGQNVTAGLQYVLDYYNNPAQGYRTDSDVKHMIVYITNTNPTDSDPSSLVQSIKRSGLYEVLVIALDMQPSDALTRMVNNRCFYYAKDYHDLMNYGVNFVQIQSCYQFSLCNY